uniref:Integrase core domain containing protein n=1 Tax=Solanum tuberosum TaxID=4113 RepID=M1DRQ4_SOLTU
MARTNLTGRDMSPRKRARGVVINEEVAASKLKKLPPKGGKGREIKDHLSGEEILYKWCGGQVSTSVDTLSDLVPQGKKKASAFKLVDFVVVRGKKVKCSSDDINVVFDRASDFIHDYHSTITTKTLEDLKEAEYQQDQADRRRAAPMDISLVVDIDTLLAEAAMPTLATSPPGTSSSTLSDTPGTSVTPPPTRSATTSTPRPPITQAMLFRMGHLV